MTTAALILKALKVRKLKPAEFARSIGMGRSTVHAWINGGPGPKLCHLRTIADELEIDFDTLLESHLRRAS